MSLPGNEGQIIYTLIAHGDTILAEYTEKTGNFEAVAKQLINKIDTSENRIMSYMYPKEKFVFHYIVDNGLTYLCMADEGFGRLIVFRFLEDIKNRFLSSFGLDRVKHAQLYAFNADFRDTIRRGMNNANDPRNMQYRSTDNKINQINIEIEKTKNTVMESIEKVLDRGDKLETLLDKSDGLVESGRIFKGSSRDLKNRMMWKNIKMTLLLVFIILIVGYVIFAFVCDFDGSKCFKK